MQQGSYTWSYLWWFESPCGAVERAHRGARGVLAMLTVGLFTRVTSILAFIVAMSYVGRVDRRAVRPGPDQRDAGHVPGGRPLGRCLLARSSGSPAAGPASRCRSEPSWTANLAIRLIQIHMCVIYLFAGMAKLTGPAWWDGTAMWMAFGNMEYQSLDMTWMADWPRLINLMTHVTIFWELFYAALVWPRATRPVVLLLAIPLHLGIAICLGMITFGLIMLVGNLAFVPPEWIRALGSRGGQQQGRGADADRSAKVPAKGSRDAARPAGPKR